MVHSTGRTTFRDSSLAGAGSRPLVLSLQTSVRHRDGRSYTFNALLLQIAQMVVVFPPFFLTFFLSPPSFLQGAALGTLVEVQLSNNGMDDEAIVALFKSMALNPDLEVLNL